jgi:hypothetical protein
MSAPQLWSAGERVLPQHLVKIDDIAAILIDDVIWIAVPMPEVPALLDLAHQRGRPAIIGEGQTFFEFGLFASQFPRLAKQCRKLERRLRVALWDKQDGRN